MTDIQKHDWFKYRINNNNVYDCCKKCGILKNTKNAEKECRGRVNVELRKIKL